ncbi:MAG: purine-nucleoside phosphorylase [Coxiellaceae bacterium]|nr:purine-nucleoside phosphorylase [Coxiellaceae bacterium]
MTQAAKDAAAYIQKKHPNFTPKVGIILGSGLGAVVEELKDRIVIPYEEIPNFPNVTVKGHGGNLHLGKLYDTPVACYEGRIHLYEGTKSEDFKTFVRTLKLIGCDTLFVTNAAGSLNRDIPTGNLVLIKDHINFQFGSPLVGPNDDEFGPRFVGMDDVYDKELREKLLSAAQKCNAPLSEGVYVGVLGPAFETPAEIQMLKTMGADVVAMSLIPEVIIARHCDMRVVAVSAVSNLAAGLHDEKLSHEVTLRGAKQASTHLVALINEVFKQEII